MNEQECLDKMVPPGQRRKGKWRDGVIQIWITRACNLSCYNCTQGSNYRGAKEFMTVNQVREACISLRGYFGVVGIFGGNPALHPEFEKVCEVVRREVPYHQRGIWCNDPMTESKGRAMRSTFNPQHSNLNVHLDKDAYKRFKTWWPECCPFGLDNDSRHSPVYVSPRDLGMPEEERFDHISQCDINQHWSAMISVFRGELRGWFCEIAGSMSMLRQHDPDWPDTGVTIERDWWKLPMENFKRQVRQHCHDCGVPLRGYGELARAKEGIETISLSWADIARIRGNKELQIVTTLDELRPQSLDKTTHYLQNAGK